MGPEKRTRAIMPKAVSPPLLCLVIGCGLTNMTSATTAGCAKYGSAITATNMELIFNRSAVTALSLVPIVYHLAWAVYRESGRLFS